MSTQPYKPITGSEIAHLRAAMPQIVAWLRKQERANQPAPVKDETHA